MHKQKKAGRWPGLPFAARNSNQFDEFELEFEDEFELEFDEEFELELDEEFDEEFELLFEDELELEFELLLELEFELLLDEEFELEFDSPRRFWPLRSFFIFKAVVTNLVSVSFAAASMAAPGLTAAKAGMMNEPAATAVAASKFVSFLI
jgi:hypothetical protein